MVRTIELGLNVGMVSYIYGALLACPLKGRRTGKLNGHVFRASLFNFRPLSFIILVTCPGAENGVLYSHSAGLRRALPQLDDRLSRSQHICLLVVA